MVSKQEMPNIHLLTNNRFTPREIAFITVYLATGNATKAVIEAGYKVKAPEHYGSALLRKSHVIEEISAQIAKREQAKIASATEVLQFYSSVMRGELLDQFGIEASLDTRIKAANELAKHQIEIPMKLQQRENSNNLGSITLNFLPRNDEN